MKFEIFLALLIGMMLGVAVATNGKAKRDESLMEYMNGFFSGSTDSSLDQSSAPSHHRHARKNHKRYSFKEKVRVPLGTKGPGTNNSTNSVAGASGNVAGAYGATETAATDKASQGPKPLLESWYMISSPSFQNTAKFPPVKLHDGSVLTIKTDSEFFRINDAFSNASGDKGPTEKFFWFRLSGLNIYYSATKTDINILGAVGVKKIIQADHAAPGLVNGKTTYCFTVEDTDTNEWRLCTYEEKVVKQWVCKIKELLGENLSDCGNSKSHNGTEEHKQQNFTQPIIIIPLPSRKCNQEWNYQKNGDDWECDCAEGKEQAPIDLPPVEKALDSPVKPFFNYEEVGTNIEHSSLEGQLKKGETLKLELIDNSLRILHHKLGKVVTVDGAVYFAQEIVIHTPAEHTIDGKKFDMEVQIVHYGQTKGDIAKQLILSFLIEKTPGVYNKFIDDLDMFNLPNPITKETELSANIFIPKILYSADDSDIPTMKPFSFYTYQGSLTAPPCTENTIIYVASTPIKLGSTAIQLFQEALRVPDMMDQKGDVVVSNWIPQSNRNVQDTNGRPVFHYDHEKYCGPDPVKPSPKPEGHYEKVMRAMTKYYYVNGPKPSGIPNSYVVSKKEALGKSGKGWRNKDIHNDDDDDDQLESRKKHR